jgi:phosphodiesterase/alkaline phosphatase D-like protein
MTSRSSFVAPKSHVGARHHSNRAHQPSANIDHTAPLTLNPAVFPNGVSSGDVTQDSVVLWTRALQSGHLVFQIATDASFNHVIRTAHVSVSNTAVPVKAEFDHLKAGEQYYYRAIDASGDTIVGTFDTAAKLGTHDGFHFGVGGDNFGELAPYVGLANAPSAGLDLFVKLGDTIYADLAYQGGTFVPTVTTTLAEFQAKHDTVYGTHLGLNYWADLQSVTPILSVIDDHEVVDDFAGGEHPSSDPRFTGQTGDFINETPLFKTGLKAFNQYNAIEDRVYHGTGDDLFDGATDLYRYNTYGSDAAIIMLDARSFRDEEIAAPTNPLSPAEIGQFLTGSFNPDRTMLGDVQLERLEQDLLDARDNGLTWKFVMLPEAIQNFGPVIGPGDRYEGYAAERNALLRFIEQNHIENVVFVSSDTHWTSVNNLTYQDFLGGPQIATSVFEVNTLAVASIPIAPQVPAVAKSFGLISQAALDFYNFVLQVAPDITDNNVPVPDDKDDFVEQLLSGYMASLGYDPIGLDHNLAQADGKINATLLAGDYFVGHNFGWTDFNIDAITGKLMVTTWGVPLYTDLDVANNAVLGFTPSVVSQFEVTPTSNSIIGTKHGDHLDGTSSADVILGAGGNDLLQGRDGDDYLDGGDGNDFVRGGKGNDNIFGRDGNDFLNGGDGADRIEGGKGNDKANGDSGDDIFVATVGDGNDAYDGGHGTDTLDLSQTSAPAKVSLERGTASSDDIGFDRLDSVENVIGSSGDDRISGDNGANRLDGGIGDDTIDGDRGNDIIIGGAGNDALKGGPGNDTFVFHAGFGTDTISDFSAGPGIGDIIQVDQTMFADFAAILLATSDLGADLKIASGADAIVLKNVSDVTNLNTDDFAFV